MNNYVNKKNSQNITLFHKIKNNSLKKKHAKYINIKFLLDKIFCLLLHMKLLDFGKINTKYRNLIKKVVLANVCFKIINLIRSKVIYSLSTCFNSF